MPKQTEPHRIIERKRVCLLLFKYATACLATLSTGYTSILPTFVPINRIELIFAMQWFMQCKQDPKISIFRLNFSQREIQINPDSVHDFATCSQTTCTFDSYLFYWLAVT